MRPVDQAEAASQAIRALNRATLWPDEPENYRWPADVDAVVGSLTVLAQRLPQSLGQAARWLERVAEAGAVGHDGDLDGAEQARTAAVLLRFAGARAETLAEDLNGLRQITAHLTGETPLIQLILLCRSSPEVVSRELAHLAPRQQELLGHRRDPVG